MLLINAELDTFVQLINSHLFLSQILPHLGRTHGPKSPGAGCVFLELWIQQNSVLLQMDRFKWINLKSTNMTTYFAIVWFDISPAFNVSSLWFFQKKSPPMSLDRWWLSTKEKTFLSTGTGKLTYLNGINDSIWYFSFIKQLNLMSLHVFVYGEMKILSHLNSLYLIV